MKQRPQKGLVVWMTGLSGAGKSTLAQALATELTASGYAVYILDGDTLRRGLCSDMGFSREDRAGEVAALFADAGLICIAAFVSPYREDRARAADGPAGAVHRGLNYACTHGRRGEVSKAETDCNAGIMSDL